VPLPLVIMILLQFGPNRQSNRAVGRSGYHSPAAFDKDDWPAQTRERFGRRCRIGLELALTDERVAVGLPRDVAMR
jgi:hypothetical protein